MTVSRSWYAVDFTQEHAEKLCAKSASKDTIGTLKVHGLERWNGSALIVATSVRKKRAARNTKKRTWLGTGKRS